MKNDFIFSLPLEGGGKGGGEYPDPVPPHLYPLPPRGEEVFWLVKVGRYT